MAIVGRVVSTLHVNEAGVASVLPAASVARTWKVCEPSARPVYCLGEVQAVKPPASSWHWKLTPPSGELKVKLAVLLLLLAAGFESMAVSGAAVSLSTVALAVALLPTASVCE